jgi:type VI secretion system protein VasG
VLPKPSEEFLKRMMEGRPVERVRVTVSAGDFGYAFD